MDVMQVYPILKVLYLNAYLRCNICCITKNGRSIQVAASDIASSSQTNGVRCPDQFLQKLTSTVALNRRIWGLVLYQRGPML